MNNNKNPNLPANAIAVADVAVGMVVETAFTGKVGEVVAIRDYYFSGRRIFTLDNGTEIRANVAGTLRLA